MNEQDRENLYRLFRNQADLLGSSQLTVVALQSFIAAVKALRCPRQEVMSHFSELAVAIKHTQPHIVPLIHLIEEFISEIDPLRDAEMEAIRAGAIRILEDKIAKIEEQKGRLVEQGIQWVKDGDVILVHAVSTVVLRILVRAYGELGRRFQVIVLEQDFAKTRRLLQTLDGAAIPHTVIPEYTLSHVIQQATKLFLGAVAVTPDYNVVTPAGTANIVSLCHVERIPVCLFVGTLKFSHIPSESQQIHRKEEHRQRGGLSYDLTTYSHCLVPISLIDHVITETGEYQSTPPF